MKKIGILRANALGDLILALPAVEALRQAYPDAEIVWLGKAQHQAFLMSRPSPVDRVVVIPPYPGVGEAEDYIPNETAVSRFFQDMEAEHFDVVFQMHGGGRYSNSFVRRLGAALTMGFRTPEAEPLQVNIAYTRYFSENLRYLELVAYAGAQPVALPPRVSVTPEDIQAAKDVLYNPAEKPLVVLHPGATDLRRRWPTTHFASVADQLVERGYHIAINGVSGEFQIGEKIIAAMQYPEAAQNLGGALSLSGLVGLLSMADLMISNDSGPLHLAYALQTPAVGIYWVGNYITGTPLALRLARPLVSWTSHCPLCGRAVRDLETSNNHCTHLTTFVGDITPEQVMDAVAELQDNQVVSVDAINLSA